MIVDDVVERVFKIYGERRGVQEDLSESEVLDLMNDGMADLRAEAADEWDRDQDVVVANQRVYNYPADCIRLIALFWDEEFIPPVTMFWLDSRDESWITRQGETICWTQDGLAWNQYGLYKIPEVTSEFPITFSIDTVPPVADRVTSPSYGIIVDVDDSDVQASIDTVPPVADRVSSVSFGIFVDGFEATDSDFGIITSIEQASNDLMSRWYVKRHETFTSFEQEVPVPEGWVIALVWYVLWKIYEQAGERHNAVLAGFYREQYLADRNGLKQRARKPTPRIVHKLAPASGLAKGPFPYAESMIDPATGLPVRLLW